MTDLSGRLILITGATRGLGSALAIACAKAGADLILTGRTTGALEEVDDAIKQVSGKNATLVPVDFNKKLDSIDELGAAIFQRWGKLDAVVGNAAMLGALSPITHISPKEFEQVMQINFTANFRLLRSLDPLLRASTSGRAAFITSSVGHSPRAYWGTYALSKAALEHMVKVYALENQKTNVKTNIINPGRMNTMMRKKAYPTEDHEALPKPKDVAEKILPFLAESCDVSGKLFSVPDNRFVEG